MRPLPAARALSPLMALAALLAAGCSSGASAQPAGPARTLRLGLFANVTHATALAGVAQGFYSQHLGATRLATQTFNAGPAAVEAVLAGSVDAVYLGPNPAVNAFVRSDGEAVRVVAGAAVGGAELVVRPEITSPGQLRGRTLATPQLGGSQDVAARSWLAGQGLATSWTGGGDLTVAPTDNASTVQLFRDRKIDGAWLPEPWASRLVLDGGGRVLVDERSLWPEGRFASTNLLVSTAYLRAHPDAVRALLAGQVETNGWIGTHPEEARRVVAEQVRRLGGTALRPAVLDRAFSEVTVTDDPVAATLATSAAHAHRAGLLSNTDLSGICDLRLLNAVLAEAGRPPVSDAGLGRR